MIFTWQGAVVAATVVDFPLVFKAARIAFENVGGNYENAAHSLGCNPWQVFWRISLPLAGRYAKDALETAGIWQELSGKLIFAENVRQVFDYLRRGEVDAGFAYATDAVKDGAAVFLAAASEKMSF